MAEKLVEQLYAGDIILYPPHDDDWLAKLIAKFTSGSVNHAAILYTAGGEDQKVIESVLQGVRFNPIRPTSDEYRAKVMRMKEKRDMQPVLDAAIKYMGNNYPFAALGLLAILLLFGKRKPTVKNKLLYCVMEYVTLGLMLLNQRIAGKGKEIMTCSQFTAQAFSDAGKDYALHFKHLLVDDFLDEPTVPVNRLKNNLTKNSESVPDYDAMQQLMCEEAASNFEQINGELSRIFGSANHVLKSDGVSDSYDEVLEVFNKNPLFRKNGTAEEDGLSGSNESRNRLLAVMDKIVTGKTNRKVQDIIKDFQSETYRNFFVTPEDLFNGNCDSIEYVGDY